MSAFTGLSPAAADGDLVELLGYDATNIGNAVTIAVDGEFSGSFSGLASEFFTFNLYDASEGFSLHPMTPRRVYTLGTPSVVVADVANLSQTAAVAAISGLGLGTKIGRTFSSTVAKGNAVETNPPVYSLVDPSFTVEILISLGSAGAGQRRRMFAEVNGSLSPVNSAQEAAEIIKAAPRKTREISIPAKPSLQYKIVKVR